MEKSESEKNNEFLKNQKSLYIKFKRINKLFKVHFSSLNAIFWLSIVFMIIWLQQMITGQLTLEILERYGSLGAPWIIFLTSLLLLFMIQTGGQITFYGIFLIKGNRCLKQAKDTKESKFTAYKGTLSYLRYLYKFFNRLSKKKTNLSTVVKIFLLLNFVSGYFIIFIITRFIDIEIASTSHPISMGTIFLLMLGFWLITLITSFKIGKELTRWEKLFPQLEEWGQKLENISNENL